MDQQDSMPHRGVAEYARFVAHREVLVYTRPMFGEKDQRHTRLKYAFVGIGWKNPSEIFFANQRQRKIFEIRAILRESTVSAVT